VFKIRIGVFLCQCRGEISSHLNIDELSEYCKSIEGVEYVHNFIATCSSSAYKELIQKIKSHKIDRVVIAACSPKYYEEIFRKNVEAAGVNPGHLEMANIREQCAWPHSDAEKRANDKARLLLKVAIDKVKISNEITLERSSVQKSVLVIGGGIAGIHAALSLAEQGIQVYLVEKEATIGGYQVRFAKAFPRDECSPCAFAPIITRLVNNSMIKTYTLSEVTKVGGRVGEYSVTVTKHPRFVDEEKCYNCGDCTEVCPKEIPNKYEFNLGTHKRIHLPYSEAHPHVHVVSSTNIEDCRHNCHRYCEKICSVKAVKLDQKEEIIDLKVGGIIVATGYSLYVPTEFNYGATKNVLTLAEYERLCAPDGTTKGVPLRVSDKKEPNSIAFILCVGSRDPKKNPYCSKYCCMASATLVQQTRDKLPNTKIYVFYKDIQTVGKFGEEYVRRAQELPNVEWIRSIPTDSTVIENDRVRLTVNVGGGLVEMDVDMLVLANALEPNKDTDILRKVIGLDKTEEGFYRESDIMLNPVSTFDPGKYICGTCVGPKSIAETITEARSAAASIASILGANEIIQEVLVSKVDEDLCGNCKVCLRTCIFGAVGLDEKKNISMTDTTLCRGCGNCVAACPSGARDLVMYPGSHYIDAIRTLSKIETGNDPKILVLACNGCAYPAIDSAAHTGLKYPSSVVVIRTPCAGRVDTQYIEYAFACGYEGVMIGTCHLGSCHYVVGNEDVMKRVDLLRPLLRAKGVEDTRLRIEDISPTEGAKFIKVIHKFIDDLKFIRSQDEGV
jgi:heterodisulfide reductase subunit A2